MKLILIALFAFTINIQTTSQQLKNENEIILRISSYLSALEKIGFHGSVLVELNRKEVISKGYGYSSKEQRINNSSTTIFDIGSITKQFTAAAILKLEMQEKLSTDDMLSKFFDNVPDDKKSITIHDLLRHQSGLPGSVGGDYEKISEDEFLNKVFKSTLRFYPGTNFSYSNIGYSLLALIIEKVSGQSYENYLYDNLLKPANMELTGYSRPRFDTNLIAIGYYTNDSAWGKPTDKEWDINAPYWHLKGNGGILSTAEDLYKWHNILMTDKILSFEAKQKLYHPKLRIEENETSYYAYGWDVSKTSRNTTQVWHNGTNHIFYTDFLRYIDEGITLTMLSNKFHPNFNGINREISKIIFNENYKPEIPVEDNETNQKFTKHIIKTIQNYGLENSKELYQKRDKTENLLEFLMRDEGFRHIDNNKPVIALLIFEMNVFVNPKSAKALQGLGEGYMETGKIELALKYFRQSLNIDPDNHFVSDMIKKLEQ